MLFFDSLFYVLWRGIAIGILISAPMGPVGILCIQRTLYKGRKTGLYTGIGAALSDLIYCILTGFGLSFIEEFLERNQNVIQLVGSVVLIAFAIYLFKKNPAATLKSQSEEISHVSPHKNILGGFLFTFSNPLILFLIIGLFARFNFSIPEISFYYYIAGYLAIFAGAILWWEFVTFSVNKLRAHFNVRSMWLINRIIGVVILLFAFVGIYTGISNLVQG
ncbi:MAG: LysE family transporter [Muribaculaceae bacterium]|nr:LysE family transporter [Muribaculaceae bacterium]